MKQKVLLVVALVLSLMPAGTHAQQTEDMPPGETFDIGGHKMHIRCQGPLNSPITVVFESGGGGAATDWSDVQSLLVDIRTCAYDRAGLGWSEPGPLPRTMRQEVFELNELLKTARVHGPLVLVGHSLGGMLVRLYSQYYGEDVVGIVLVDPTTESSMLGSMRYGGWTRIREKAMGYPIPEPRTALKDSVEYDPNVDFLAEEFQLMYLSRQANPKMLGDRPLVVLAGGKRTKPPGTSDDFWKTKERERDEQLRALTKLSGNSIFIEDPESGHAIQNDNPELVAHSIEKVIEAVLKHSKLSRQ